MKLGKRIAAAAVSTVMLFGVAGLQANAATVTQDGLNVSLTADKTEYKKDEPITATLTAENTGGTAVKNVMLENIVPEGYELAKDYSLTKTVDELKSGDKAELKVVYNAKSGVNVTPSNNNTPASTMASAAADTVKTGDSTNAYIFVVLLLASIVIGIGVFCIKKKKGKELLSAALSLSMLGTVIPLVSVDTKAADTSKTIEIIERIKADKKDIELKANVSIGSESEAEKYYRENAEIISFVNVSPEETLSEAKVTKLLNEKGFTDYPITYNYSLSGDFNDDQEGDSSSEVKHPMYGTYYISKNNEIWYVTVVGKEIYANPLSFNIQTERKVPTMLSTSNTIISYDDEKDRLYTIIPKESAMIVVKVDDINSDVLDNLTVEEVSKL